MERTEVLVKNYNRYNLTLNNTYNNSLLNFWQWNCLKYFASLETIESRRVISRFMELSPQKKFLKKIKILLCYLYIEQLFDIWITRNWCKKFSGLNQIMRDRVLLTVVTSKRTLVTFMVFHRQEKKIDGVTNWMKEGYLPIELLLKTQKVKRKGILKTVLY